MLSTWRKRFLGIVKKESRYSTMIPQSFISTLLDRVDIVEVVGAAVPLKKAGSNYVAPCPFHTEKSGSFTVSPTKQFYHCFGCGAHGTAISFLIEYEGVSFPDAVGRLARNVGLVVPIDQTAPARDQQVGYDACSGVFAAAAAFYHRQLLNSTEAMDYLGSRGISRSTISEFQLGYATGDWNQLRSVYSDYGDNRTLIEAGLVGEQDPPRARRYDRFRNRIMFPILSRKGQHIGFGGRVLDQALPKYLNSPESVCFRKGEELYSHLSFQKAVRAEGRAIVVEGYMDVLQLFQHGLRNVAGTLGTATTAHHLKCLFRITDSVVFVFDGDRAGQAAARRAMELALPHITDHQSVSFVSLPDEHDPDSFARAHGADRFRSMVDEAKPLSTFLLEGLMASGRASTAEQLALLITKATEHLARIQRAPLLRELILLRLASASGVPVSTLLPIVACESIDFKQDQVTHAVALRPRTPANRLLALFAVEPELARRRSIRITPCDDDGSNELMEVLRVILTTPTIRTFGALVQHLQGTNLHDVVVEALSNDPILLSNGFDADVELEHVLVIYNKGVVLRELERRVNSPSSSIRKHAIAPFEARPS